MSIHFMPNDPKASADMPMRKQPARKRRPQGRAGLRFPAPAPAEAPAAPGTAEFLYWQCREAALAALEMWESIAGPVTKWARAASPGFLDVEIDASQELNAYYNGQSLSFFHYPVRDRTMFSGASTDVVSHECGHALLDCVRPELWDVNFIEVGAFHEAFGDCIAILTALDDKPTRLKLLSISGDLSKPSFVEALAEDLSGAVRAVKGKNHPAAEPRHALNRFNWALPQTLPAAGPPRVLTSEVHSFGRVFVGCFYDLIRLVFASQSARSESNLRKAAQVAAKLLIDGARNAPVTPRFFQSVGRAMALSDDRQNLGKYKAMIGVAFKNHAITLGSAGMIVPRAALAGSSPKPSARAGLRVDSATIRDIKRRMGASSMKSFSTSTLTLGSTSVGAVVHSRHVGLDSLGAKLRGVVAVGHESTLVSESNKRAALASTFPEPSITESEVLDFVRTLLKYNLLRPGQTTKLAAAGKEQGGHLHTHRIRIQGKARILERIGYACGCSSGGAILPRSRRSAFAPVGPVPCGSCARRE